MLPKCLSLFIATLIVAARPASATNCSDLVGVSIPDVTVTSATNVAAGQFTPPASANALETAGFCRVVAVAKPTSDSIINFEVWIPSGERWNHDFLRAGNGGYNGVIQYESLAGALNRDLAQPARIQGTPVQMRSCLCGGPPGEDCRLGAAQFMWCAPLSRRGTVYAL